MGAQFEVTDYAATGSGSPAVRGILYYENHWGVKPLQELSEDEAVSDRVARARHSRGIRIHRLAAWIAVGKSIRSLRLCRARDHDIARRQGRQRL